jgi:hypothetical protein
MVTAVQEQPTCGVWWNAENCFDELFEGLPWVQTAKITTFELFIMFID